MGAQKKLLAVAARALARAEPTDANIRAANQAEAELVEHERKQKLVDEQEGKV
jgi:hypothetical protein